ncbi:hemolysin family protein [Proteiniborus sp. MB09-C3]|uniref:hemolysin family protein n=1 Tax=Proteiniborus sp. MB09-C3 TaxID=3050072 RepID=UPI002554BBE3|nr:hemolysin family protein [Proteiniborus sp. MB09-C3]WIV10697.1 hemolysin family protein [Proteiniborus sp. MB09-C3]
MYMRIILVFVLLLFSAFFSSSETAITSIPISKIRQLKEEDEESSEILKSMKRKTNDIIASILIGNNIVNTAATAVLTELIVENFVSKNSTLIATIIMTILILVIGEITPKSFAAQNPVKVAVKVAKPLELLATIFKPILFILTNITNGIIKLLGGEVVTNTPFVTEEEIRSLVDVGEEEGTIRHQEKEMIEGIFEINDIDVTEVMVPRIDIVAISEDSNLREALNIVITYGHSRIPVYKDTIDNIVGILYAKDILPFASLNDQRFDEKKVTEIMRLAYYVPETKNVNQLLKELQQQKVHMAIVLDEYGGTEGLVTIEDILEEIVGDILDEYDNEVDLIEKINDNEFLVKADISLEEINEIFETNLPEEDFDSLGGFVFSTLGRVPVQGDIVVYENLQMTVVELDNRRIVTIEVRKKEEL